MKEVKLIPKKNIVPLAEVTLFLTVLFLIARATCGYHKAIFSEEKTYSEQVDVLKYIKKHTDNEHVVSTLAYSKFSEPKVGEMFIKYLPNLITTIANRKILHQMWQYDPQTSPENITREILNHWLNTGAVSLVPSCEVEFQKYRDMFSLTIDAYRIRRDIKCKLFSDLISKPDLCELQNKYQVNYILREREDFNFNEKHVLKFSNKIWESKSKIFSLYKIDTDELQKLACVYLNPKHSVYHSDEFVKVKENNL